MGFPRSRKTWLGTDTQLAFSHQREVSCGRAGETFIASVFMERMFNFLKRNGVLSGHTGGTGNIWGEGGQREANFSRV